MRSQEEDNVSKYYDEVNRKKYTKERKEMLSSLLGSGANSILNGHSGESTVETSVSGNSSGAGSKESTTSPSLLMDLFSHSGTDCGILINEHSKSTLSIGASGSVKDDIVIHRHNSVEVICKGGDSDENHFKADADNDSVDMLEENSANSYHQNSSVHSPSEIKQLLSNNHKEFGEPMTDREK